MSVLVLKDMNWRRVFECNQARQVHGRCCSQSKAHAKGIMTSKHEATFALGLGVIEGQGYDPARVSVGVLSSIPTMVEVLHIFSPLPRVHTSSIMNYPPLLYQCLIIL